MNVEYTTLGNTGMTVSRLCLGCMSFGSTKWEVWVLEKDDALPIIERAIDLGITFFDIAERAQLTVGCNPAIPLTCTRTVNPNAFSELPLRGGVRIYL